MAIPRMKPAFQIRRHQNPIWKWALLSGEDVLHFGPDVQLLVMWLLLGYPGIFLEVIP